MSGQIKSNSDHAELVEARTKLENAQAWAALRQAQGDRLFTFQIIETRPKPGEDMGFFVYILGCSDGSFYTGHTDNLEKRLTEHASGTTGGYTATRRPVKLLFSQEFPSRRRPWPPSSRSRAGAGKRKWR